MQMNRGQSWSSGAKLEIHSIGGQIQHPELRLNKYSLLA